MVGTHAAIAVAEAAITLSVVGLVALAAARLPQGDTAPVWGLAGHHRGGPVARGLVRT